MLDMSPDAQRHCAGNGKVYFDRGQKFVNQSHFPMIPISDLASLGIEKSMILGLAPNLAYACWTCHPMPTDPFFVSCDDEHICVDCAFVCDLLRCNSNHKKRTISDQLEMIRVVQGHLDEIIRGMILHSKDVESELSANLQKQKDFREYIEDLVPKHP